MTGHDQWMSWFALADPTELNLFKQDSSACTVCPLPVSFLDVTPGDALTPTISSHRECSVGPPQAKFSFSLCPALGHLARATKQLADGHHTLGLEVPQESSHKPRLAAASAGLRTASKS